MKNVRFQMLAIVITIGMALFTTSCQDEQDAATIAPKENSVDWRTNPNSALYPPTAHPFGKSYEEWMISANARLTSFDCATLPVSTYLLQDDKHVFYLSAPIASSIYEVTVPKEKAIFTGVVGYLNDWPCPDPNFQPAPGQSMEDFLQEGAAAAIDPWTIIEVTLDGTPLDLTDYRFQTDLFYFTGNPDLANCFDPCITGESQAAVIDGYHIMLKKLSPGLHTLVIGGEIPDVWSFENTFQLMVE